MPGLFRCRSFKVTFSGITHTLVVPGLMPDYMVGIEGSASNTGILPIFGPGDGMLALVGDPFGTSDLALTAVGCLDFRRGASGYDWEGVITVTECLFPEDPNGFQLETVRRVALGALAAGSTQTVFTPSGLSSAALSAALITGGRTGPGIEVTGGNLGSQFDSSNVEISENGSGSLRLRRFGATSGGGLVAATATVQIVTFGGGWNTLQRVSLSVATGGPLADMVAEFNTAPLSPVVVPANTMIWYSYYSTPVGPAHEFRECAIAELGDGVVVGGTTIALGAQTTDVRFGSIQVLGHPLLMVQQVTIPNLTGIGTFAINGAIVSDTFGPNMQTGERYICTQYSSSNSGNFNHGRWNANTQITADLLATLDMTTSGVLDAVSTSKVQVIDFGNFTPQSMVIRKVRRDCAVWLVEIITLNRIFRFAEKPVLFDRFTFGDQVEFFQGVVGITGDMRSVKNIQIISTELDEYFRLEPPRLRDSVRLIYAFEGDWLENGTVVLNGQIRIANFGDRNAPNMVQLQVQNAGELQQVEIVTEGVVDRRTWPDEFAGVGFAVTDAALDTSYKIPIGFAGEVGAIGGSAVQSVPSVPSPIVQYSLSAVDERDSLLLIAGEDVVADEVLITDITAGITAACTVARQLDGLGQRVSVANFRSPQAYATGLRPNTEHEYYASYERKGGGGLRYQGELVRGLGLLLLYLMDQARGNSAGAVRVDLIAQRRERGYLDQFVLDGFIDLASTDVFQYIESSLVPVFPIERIQSNKGIYYKFVNWKAERSDARFVINGDSAAVRKVTGWTWEPVANEIFTEFELDYAGKRGGAEFLKTLTRTADNDGNLNALKGTIDFSRKFPRMESVLVGENATADLVLGYKVLKHSVPRKLTKLSVQLWGGEDLANLEDFDVVLYSEASVGVSEQVALVRDVKRGLREIELTLLVL